MRIIARLLAWSFLALLFSASAALAHAGLISADPDDGSVLPAPPAKMVLVYTEPVAPTAFSLIGVGGAPVPLELHSEDGPKVTVSLPVRLKTGSYLFSWRVISADGHPVNGTIGFAIGAPSGPIAAPASDPVAGVAIWLTRIAQYLALFLGVGSRAFGLVTPLPAAARRPAAVLCGLGLVLVPVAIGLQGLDTLGVPFAALLTPAPWVAAMGSSYALTEGLFAAAFGLALFPARATTVLAAALAALAPALSGHVGTVEPQAAMRAIVFVHIASLLFWLGALLPLFVLLRGDDHAGLRRFTRAIPYVIVALVGSGLTMAAAQLGPPGADWLSSYGLLLGCKLVLVALLLLLALWNRVRLTPLAESGAVVPLRRGIGVEIVLVVAILGIVSGWRFTPPPRVLAEVEAANRPVEVALAAPGAAAQMQVAPPHAGPVNIDVHLPMDAESVTVQLSNEAAGIATIDRPAIAAGGRRWTIAGLMLPAGGDWSVGVDARTDKFDITTLTGVLHLPPTQQEASMIHPASMAAALTSAVLMSSAAVAADGILPSCPTGQSFTRGPITVTGAFTRATASGAQSAGGYLTIVNAGTVPDTLTGASSPAASDVSVHQMKMNGNVMEMSALPDGLAVPAGGSVKLDPMNYHLMLTGMSAPFVQGQCVELTLHFAKAGDLAVTFNVGSLGQQVPPTDEAQKSSSMDMSGMSSMSGM